MGEHKDWIEIPDEAVADFAVPSEEAAEVKGGLLPAVHQLGDGSVRQMCKSSPDLMGRSNPIS